MKPLGFSCKKHKQLPRGAVSDCSRTCTVTLTAHFLINLYTLILLLLKKKKGSGRDRPIRVTIVVLQKIKTMQETLRQKTICQWAVCFHRMVLCMLLMVVDGFCLLVIASSLTFAFTVQLLLLQKFHVVFMLCDLKVKTVFPIKCFENCLICLKIHLI